MCGITRPTKSRNGDRKIAISFVFSRKAWELKGEVNYVCFPTGAILEGDLLYIYYGAAYERIAVASVSLKRLLAELAINKN